jgi:hypothetical protein
MRAVTKNLQIMVRLMPRIEAYRTSKRLLHALVRTVRSVVCVSMM